MFSGIVEETAKVVKIEKDRSNVHFYLTCSFADQLKIDQSVCHNGVCLTVVEINQETKTYKVTAVQETLDKQTGQLLETVPHIFPPYQLTQPDQKLHPVLPQQ